jgi:hypothetical protein
MYVVAVQQNAHLHEYNSQDAMRRIPTLQNILVET